MAPNLLGIPLLFVISPIKGGIDVFRHAFTRDIKQKEKQDPPEVDRRNPQEKWNMPKDRRERVKLALDIMVSFGKLLGSHILGLKYDGMVVVVAPVVGYDSSLTVETLV